MLKQGKYSRREFLRKVAISVCAFLLAGCDLKSKQTNTATATHSSPSSTVEPTTTQTRTTTPMPKCSPTTTLEPTGTPVPCFHLLTPENGKELPINGQISFVWSQQFGASVYEMRIRLPNGLVEKYRTENTSFDKYLGSLPMGGEYQWEVDAFDKNNHSICTARPFKFRKAQLNNSPSQQEDGSDGEEQSDCCFLAGTAILMADGSNKAIEEVVVGDRIMSFDLFAGSLIETEVLETEAPLRNEYYEILLSDSCELALTGEHPLYVRNGEQMGWGAIDPVSAQHELGVEVVGLQIGMEVMNADRQWIKISKLSKFVHPVQTYNLSKVSDTHNFFAGGVLVHNKGGGDDDIGSG